MRERRILDRARTLVVAHPAISVFGLALAARIVVAFALFTREVRTFPDEEGYLTITRAAAAGHFDDQHLTHDMKELFWFVRSFSIPVSALMRVLGPSRLVGQMYVALLGAAVAGLTSHAARRFATTRIAVLAGLVVALLPSQVVFSSTVLRESTDWLLLLGLGIAVVALHEATRGKQIAVAATCVGAALLGLYWLRPQTAFVATFATIVATVPSAVRRRRTTTVSAGLAVALLVPILGGAGIAGLSLVTKNFDRLEMIRVNLAVGSATAIDEPPTGYVHALPEPDRTALAQARKAARRLPRGILAALARPLPWERTTNGDQRASQLENLLWVPLYVLAAIGGWRLRRRGPMVTYMISIVSGLSALAAVTQGNIGTAFRHRGQILWALAILATGAFGRTAAAPVPTDVESTAV